ncbi:MAG: DUF3131 domain-containing protein, partial [Kiritimatiellae bacterium]|nr:DUF3131 domain-containing protein [Kiritimatiellia bacterium]
MILYLLAMGSPAHPLPAGAWHAWSRPYYTYDGLTYVQGVPLFLHQYSHCWVDFRDKRDAYADYFRNSRLATMAHREFCLRLRDRFPKYSESLWGMTASKGPRGYAVWGGPPATTEHPPDGTVVPCAAGGSLPFAPDITLPVLREIHHNHRDQAWGKYGFLDAFNPHTGWSAKGYIGIDQGALLLMIENYRSGNVWKWFMESPEIERAMALAGFKDTARRLDPADLDYLRDLARDTWACIAHFVHPETQMPYDNSERGPQTSVTNVGLYLAALAAAREMGFITAEEALRRAEILVGSIEKFPTWHGLHQCWHGVADLKPVAHDPWMSVVDSGNMAMGLAVAAQAFPELHDRCRGLLDAMDWSAIHDVNAGQLYGGYDMQNDKLNPDWRVDALATDSRGAAFMAIASGKVPSEIWSNLNRDMSDRHHVRYLQPGWTGGGLFMQYLTGIFLDERDTLAGRSAANLAYANMRQADELGSEVWGWSSCADPAGGYIGWGKLRDEVVTPHASVLAIGDYPREVFHNLLRLERMGARAPWQENGESFEFGFRDSLNWRTGDVAKGYLVLDQAMLFLSLANFLEDNLVRKWFHADPGVAAAVQKIPELAQPEGGDLVSVLEPGLGRIVTRPQVARQLEMPRVAEPPAIDGVLTEWTDERGRARLSFPEHLEFGFPANKDRFEAAARFAWDEKHLYIGVEVREDELVAEAPAAELYKDDAIELFLDPGNDGFVWGDAKDFQIGFSPSGPKGRPQVYAWFQKNPAPGVVVSSFLGGTPEGEDYVIEAAIPWEFLGVSGVRPGMTLPGSIAVHTVNRARTSSAKLNWSFRTESEQIRLGELKLVE